MTKLFFAARADQTATSNLRETVAASLSGTLVYDDRQAALSSARQENARWLVELEGDGFLFDRMFANDGVGNPAQWPKQAGAFFACFVKHGHLDNFTMHSVPR